MKTKIDFATLAGLFTWLMVYGISLYILQKTAATYGSLALHILFLAYGGLFWLLTRKHGRFGLQSHVGCYLLLLQLLVAFGLLWLTPARNFEFLTILTIIWAAMLPFVMRTGPALLLTIAVVVVWFGLLAWQGGRAVWITAILNGCFHLFAVMVQSASRDAENAKDELEQKHQQLLATQQLLQAASRQSERTRIARNLHDVVGHHLTALTIQLQVASHLTDGEAKVQVDKCHQLAKLLLSDVREAVSTMRQYADVSLLSALQQLVTLVPAQLKVQLDVAPQIMLSDLNQAQHLLCIVQEAISNSLKHAGATELVISAALQQQQLQLNIKDNGKLAVHWRAGNGIKGMQERAAECGGSLTLTTLDQSLQLTLSLPYRANIDA